MKILYMGQHYAPEDVSGAVLATELAEDLSIRGHQVTFVTSFPNYPKGVVFPGYKNSFVSKENIRGVNIIRTWSYISPNKSFWKRVLNFVTFSIGAAWGGLFAKKPDIILSVSPPLPLGITAWFLSKVWNVPWVLRVSDLYPEAAVSVGLLKNRSVIRLLSFLEKNLYKKSDHIFAISSGFKQNINNKGIPDKKISVVPVWADPNFVVPLEKENSLRDQFDIKDKFILLYSGNIGITSSLENVIEAAEMLRYDSRIHFVICGEGIKKEKLVDYVRERNLRNILFLPYLERQDYPLLLGMADIGLVTLNKESSNTSLPSKIFNVMASGRPILTISPEDSEIAQLVNENQCGVNVPNDNPDVLYATIIELMNSQEKLCRMGKNARKVLESKYSRQHCVDLYECLLEMVIKNSCDRKKGV